jgi:hypothetical protein
VWRSAEPTDLTVRSVAVGSLIGAVICVGNLYFAYKTGLSLGSRCGQMRDSEEERERVQIERV